MLVWNLVCKPVDQLLTWNVIFQLLHVTQCKSAELILEEESGIGGSGDLQTPPDSANPWLLGIYLLNMRSGTQSPSYKGILDYPSWYRRVAASLKSPGHRGNSRNNFRIHKISSGNLATLPGVPNKTGGFQMLPLSLIHTARGRGSNLHRNCT